MTPAEALREAVNNTKTLAVSGGWADLVLEQLRVLGWNVTPVPVEVCTCPKIDLGGDTFGTTGVRTGCPVHDITARIR